MGQNGYLCDYLELQRHQGATATGAGLAEGHQGATATGAGLAERLGSGHPREGEENARDLKATEEDLDTAASAPAVGDGSGRARCTSTASASTEVENGWPRMGSCDPALVGLLAGTDRTCRSGGRDE